MSKHPSLSWWLPEPAAEPLSPLTIGGLLRHAADQHAQRPAVIVTDFPEYGERDWTYADLRREAYDRAAGLLQSGLGPGDRIGLWAPNSAEWLATAFAVALTGATLVPVNPGYQRPELEHVIRDTGLRALLVGTGHRGESVAELIARVPREDGLGLIMLDKSEGTWPGLAELGGLARATYTDAQIDQLATAADPSATAQILYTSGTSGRPKGVQLSHRGLVNNARETARGWGVAAEDKWLNPLPFFHTGGGAMVTLGAVWNGAAMLVLPWFDPVRALTVLGRSRGTIAHLVPTMIVRMLEAHAAEPQEYDLSSLRLVGTGGAVIPPELRHRIKEQWGAELRAGYGLTETSPTITQVPLKVSDSRHLDGAGQPLPEAEVRIVGRAGETVATGEAGELQTRGYHVMTGYLHEQRGPADSDGWLSTGDLAEMSADGFITIVGRSKDMIIRGGENLYPAEIEFALSSYPHVSEVHVVGIPDDIMGEEACACLHFEDFEPPPSVESDVRAWLRDRVSREKVPRYVLAVESFPVTPSGKVPRDALRDLAQARLAGRRPG